jgi:hypothetical protein
MRSIPKLFDAPLLLAVANPSILSVHTLSTTSFLHPPRRLQQADADGNKIVSFDEFWSFALNSGTGHGVDPVLDANAYLSTNKVISVLEAMTAALMVAKPEDPRAFLAGKLMALKATGTPVLEFTDEELVTMFSMFDPTGVGNISGEQCNKALEVLTGHMGTVGLGGGPEMETGAPVSQEQFVGHAKGALKEFSS